MAGVMQSVRRRRAEPLKAILGDRSNVLVAALEHAHTNLFIADLDLDLVWMNRRATKTIGDLAEPVRETFGLPIGELLGGSIHRFHKDPGRVERILNEPGALPRQAIFTFGPITLSTQINAITVGSGDRVGYIVAWDNITERSATADAAVTQVEAAGGRLSETWESVEVEANRTAELAEANATATEQMRAAVGEIAKSSVTAADNVRRTVEATETGEGQLLRLHASTNEIGRVLELITSLSDQTKMLALNATIEAARAGEAGKGFAVVADEVKQLAETTAASISDIEERIDEMASAAEESVQALRNIAECVREVEGSNSSIGAAIEEQSAVTDGIAAATEGIAGSAKRTVDLSVSFGESISEMLEEASRLREIVRNG